MRVFFSKDDQIRCVFTFFSSLLESAKIEISLMNAPSGETREEETKKSCGQRLAAVVSNMTTLGLYLGCVSSDFQPKDPRKRNESDQPSRKTRAYRLSLVTMYNSRPFHCIQRFQRGAVIMRKLLQE